MKWLAIIAFATCLSSAFLAQADDGDRDVMPARFAAGFNAMLVREKQVLLIRKDFRLSPEFSYGRWTFSPALSLYETDIDLHEKDGLPLDLSLTLPWQPVIGMRVEYRAWSFGAFDLKLRGEFESPFSPNEATIDSFTAKGELAKLPIDTSTIRQHVRMRQSWRSANGSLILRANLGALHPWLQFGYLALSSSIAVDIDSQAQTLLSAVNTYPSRFYKDGAASVFYSVGADVEVGGGYALRISGALLPASRTYATADCTLVVPLDILSH